jgi:predicted RNA binding protein YcfA (HicA-like mRNA interferase family)
MGAKHDGRGRDPAQRQLVKTAKRAGWTVERASSGHVKFRSPSGQLVVGSFSGSARGAKDLRAGLRRAGLSC